MKILRDQNLVFRDLLVKVRDMVKKYSKSVNAKIELDKLVHIQQYPEVEKEIDRVIDEEIMFCKVR